jgi:anti-sigma factor RsiW
MVCERWNAAPEQFDRYLDGELDPAEARVLGTHLRECVLCAADLLERVQIKRTVHTAGKRYEPSAEFRAKIARTVAANTVTNVATTLRGLPQPARSPWRFAWIPAFAVPIVAVLFTAYWMSGRATQRVYSELADLHVATLASASPVDVISSDRHTVKPWFQGKIPFTFNLPELAGSQFTLLGGRIAYLEQLPGAHLIYQVRKHEISVFIFPENGADMRRLPSGAANASSFNSETWTANGLRYFVIGDASSEDIVALEKLLRSVQ